MRFEFIENHGEGFPVRLLCRLMKVSVSGYYAWRKRPPSSRTQEDAELEKEIIRLHDESHQTYGYRRIYHALLALGRKAGQRRVARLMRHLQRQGRQYRRYVMTTKPGKRLPHIADLLQRKFTANQPNQAWVADITYVHTNQGWLYVAAVLDLFSRRIVGGRWPQPYLRTWLCVP